MHLVSFNTPPLTWFYILPTLQFWLTKESRRTRAHRLMVDNLAQRVNTASSNTRISTFLIETSSVSRAILINNTFRINTRCYTSYNSALAISTARRRIARIDRSS